MCPVIGIIRFHLTQLCVACEVRGNVQDFAAKRVEQPEVYS